MRSVHYLGNQNLKRDGVKIAWTDEMIQEWIRCRDDIHWFVRKYVKIINVDRGLIPFEPYPYQIEMLNLLARERNVIITMCRQSGKSTTVGAFILWYILFHNEVTVGLVANKAETARELLGRIRLAYEHLPFWLQQGAIEWNKGSLVLENNSRVIATSTTANSLRGYSINLLYVDEAAFVPDFDDFFASILPTVSSGQSTKVVLVSTPNGLNHYYNIWIRALEGTNSYKPLLVTWEQVPGRDEAWKQAMLASMNGDMTRFRAEFECEFLGSDNTLIDLWKLRQLHGKKPIFEHQGLKRYETAMPKRLYFAAVDVSRGRGLDASVIQLLDITSFPFRQVAVFRSTTIQPYDLTRILYHLAREYNDAFVLIETNDCGQQVADILHEEFQYENILYTTTRGRAGRVLTSDFSPNATRGLPMTEASKRLGCSMLKLLVEQNKLLLVDEETIQELSVFTRHGSSYAATKGHHDDLVMALVLFAWASNQQFFQELVETPILKSLSEYSDDDMLPFGFNTSDMLSSDKYELTPEQIDLLK